MDKHATLQTLQEIRSFLLTKLHEEKNKKSMNMDDFLRVQEWAKSVIPDLNFFNDQEHQLQLILESIQQECGTRLATEAASNQRNDLTTRQHIVKSFQELIDDHVYELDPSIPIIRLFREGGTHK